MVPQTGLIIENSARRGRSLKLSEGFVRSDQSFNTYATKVWNELPKEIRGITNVSVTTFKSSLDKYLSNIEDDPHVIYDGARRCHKEDKKRMLGGSPISTML